MADGWGVCDGGGAADEAGGAAEDAGGADVGALLLPVPDACLWVRGQYSPSHSSSRDRVLTS